MKVDRADLDHSDVEVAREKLPWPPAELDEVDRHQRALVIGQRDVLEAQVLGKRPLQTSDLESAALAAGQTLDQRDNCARPASVRR